MTPLSVLNLKNKNHNKRIKKRHYFLASVIVVVGSWITHSTTANINSDAQSSTEQLNAPVQVADIQTEDKELTDTVTAIGFLPQHDLSENEPLPTSTNKTIDEPQSNIIAVVNYKIKKGDSLGGIFKKLNLDLSLPYKISQHESAKKLVSIAVGKKISFELGEADQLHRIVYPKSKLQDFVVNFQNGKVSNTKLVDRPYQTEQATVSGEITSSLFLAAKEAGVSNAIIMEMVRIFGWDVDFALDIRKGDQFHIIYNRHTLNGETLKDGNILAAEFTTQGQTYQAIRFEDDKGKGNYYTPQGESMLGTFLRSPVEFSRISSKFGKRKHPILKTWRAHNGVDYAAARGTPILATADGKVTLAGKKGGYGRTVIISHAGRFSSLYAHMSRYGKGIKSGVRVKQGQIIGYIGSSGLATGPHLHYEFRVDGVHRNPLTYKTPKAKSIAETSKAKFLTMANKYTAQLKDINVDYQLAKAPETSINR